MEPNKFEEHIKEKLDQRTLQPSTEAWNKLSARLDENNKRNNKPFWWLGIAAAIAGILLVSSQFFKSNSIEDVTPQIVVTPEVIKDDIEVKDANANIAKEVSDEIKLKEDKKLNQIKTETITIQTDLTKENIAIVKENNMHELNDESLKPENVIVQNLTLEDQKIQDVVAQIKNLKDNNSIVTDETIDMLLADAQKEIALEQLYNENTGVVDANLLLKGVEADLEESFRAKVFKALKENFITVKTAVAQRND